MDDFERDLVRVMRQVPESGGHEPARRETIRARVSARRRTRAAWTLGSSALALGALGFGLFAVPGSPVGPGPAPDTTVASPAPSRSGLLTIPDGADDQTRSAYQEENAIAVCMRARGFAYTPEVPGATDPDSAVDGQDYEKAKAFRQKYGYGLFAGPVYPDDPNAPMSAASQARDETDAHYRASLDPARRAAYDKALGAPRAVPGQAGGMEVGQATGCTGAAERQVGPGASQAAGTDGTDAAQARQDKAQQELDADPRLVALAHAYGTCLRSKGIAVTTEKPSQIPDMVKFQESAKLPADGTSHMSKETAQPLLAKDIAVALADLQCGKAFRAAYFPEYHRLDPQHTA